MNKRRTVKVFRRTLWHMFLIVTIVAGPFLMPVATVQAGQTDIVGPAGSGSFGTSVTVLPNGNIVVTDPEYDAGSTADVGAVYLYDGATLALISTLTGSTADDRVGSGDVVVLSNGNYVVHSPDWDNGTATDAGAVTWGSRTIGISGVVSSTNSLVGSTTDDEVGYEIVPLNNGNYVVRSLYWDNGGESNAGAVTWGNGTVGVSGVVSSTNSLVGSTDNDRVGYVTELSNGNYLVESPDWDNGTIENAGAVTWGDGTTGISGVISSTNSLVGSTANDRVGGYVTALSNGNYVVRSSGWDNGTTANVGAATWGNGTTGITGTISSTNSLVGSTANDYVGGYVEALNNGNYVVCSDSWDNGGATDAGAATWGNGTTGITGTVSVANSLVGSTTDDWVGGWGVEALNNGNYVVRSLYWDNGGIADAGAATWGNGTTGITGTVSATNSLVGSTAGDWVGDGGVTPLSNGNYVVNSTYWANGGATDAGAATWGNGTTGITGTISPANSLVGSTAGDSVGYLFGVGVKALSNGNYVVPTPYWDNGTIENAGAVTWGDGTTGITGTVSAANSLVGSWFNDQVGYWGVEALSNGNYVVRSPYWDNGGATDAGAVTWGDGTVGITGTISAANSLVGYRAGDQVGNPSVVELSNGNYVVFSPYWDNGGTTDAGAVTWGNGTTGISGLVSSANSLVGSTTGDRVGYGGGRALSNGSYVVKSSYWDNGGTADAGAVTLGNGTVGTSGPVTGVNSVRGTAAGGGPSMVFAYDDTNDQLVVGRPADNIITLLANDAPIADAGSDQEVNRGTLVTLDGSGSSDPDSDLPLTYLWTQTGGPAVTFTPSLSVTTFAAPSTPTVLTFTLAVTDTWGLASTPDEVVVSVLAINQINGVTPAAHSHTAAITTNLTITTSETVSQTSITTRTVSVHGGFHGHLDGAFSFGSSITFNPNPDLLPGELVQTSVATGVLDSQSKPLKSPYVWQFRAAASGGSGHFPRGNTIGLGGDYSQAVVAGDVDGGGDLDLIVVNWGQPNVVYMNDGDGTFNTISHTVGTGSDTTAGLALGDLDGDGDLDLAVSNLNSQSAVYLNDGDGTYDTISHTLGSGPDSTRPLALGDMDGDGDLDVVVGNWGPSKVYLNDGDGTFDTAFHTLDTGSSNTRALAVGDVDGDGDLDLVFGRDGQQNTIYLNDGDGTFDTTSYGLGPSSDVTYALVTGDVDGDGDLDLAVGNWGQQGIIHLNDGDGTFDTISHTVGTASDNTHSLALADMDGDGDLDLTAANNGTQNTVYLNDGDGTFDTTSHTIGTGSDTSTRSLAAGDVDGDGDLDLALANDGAQNVVYLNTDSADLTIDKDLLGPSLVYPGDAVTYTLTISNAGPQVAFGVVVTDRIPVSITHASLAVQSSLAITAVGSISTAWEIEPLNVGEWGVITVTGVLSAPLAAGTFTNTTIITSTTMDTNTANNSSSAWLTVGTIPNQPPVANAGENQSVDTNAIVTLNGSSSNDPDGDLPLTYLWTQIGGPAVTLGNPAVAAPVFTAPSDPAVLIFTLAITDSLGLPDSTPDVVIVTVNNQPPEADAGDDQTVDTNTLVTLDGSGSSDPDGDLPLSYYWIQTGGPAVTFTPNMSVTTFTVPSDSAVLTFTLLVIDSLGLVDPTPDEVVITVTEYHVYLPLVLR